MPKKKKIENLIKKEAPEVNVTLIDGPKNKEEIPDNLTIDPTNDLITGEIPNNVDTIDIKKMIFEKSPNNSKSIVINKEYKKYKEIKKLNNIKARLTLRPIISSYRGSRTRPNSNRASFSFKLGRNH